VAGSRERGNESSGSVRRRISWLAEWLLSSQEGLCSVESDGLQDARIKNGKPQATTTTPVLGRSCMTTRNLANFPRWIHTWRKECRTAGSGFKPTGVFLWNQYTSSRLSKYYEITDFLTEKHRERNGSVHFSDLRGKEPKTFIIIIITTTTTSPCYRYDILFLHDKVHISNLLCSNRTLTSAALIPCKSLDMILCQLHPIHIVTTYFTKIKFNVILSTTHKSYSLPMRVTSPAHLILLDSIDITRRVLLEKLKIAKQVTTFSILYGTRRSSPS
jgi:hypothetical protein